MRIRYGSAALAFSGALVLAGCGAEPESAQTTEASDTTETSADPEHAESGDSTDQPEEDDAEENGTRSLVPGSTAPASPEVIATDLDVPWGIDFLPDGDVLVTLRDQAEVLLIDGEGRTTSLGAVEDVTPDDEGGLLGIAVSPDFEQDATIYLYFTTAADNRIQAFTLDEEELQAGEVILQDIPRASFHNGGRIAFGPDGYLYAGTGDAGMEQLSQDESSLGGKILRIDADGRAPEDNPNEASPVWTWGHRNVQGLAWDDQEQMFASEFGQDTWDELNLIEPGQNYGWPAVEGDGGGGEYTDPLVQWTPAEASPSGIAVADGAVWMTGLRGQSLWQIPLDGQSAEQTGEPERFLEGDYGRLRDVVLGPDERLWVLTNNTARGEPSAQDDQLIAFDLE